MEEEREVRQRRKTHLVGHTRGLSRADGAFVDVSGEEEGAMGRAQRLAERARQHGRGAAAARTVWVGVCGCG